MSLAFIDPLWENLDPKGSPFPTIYEHKETKQICFFPPFNAEYLTQVLLELKGTIDIDLNFLQKYDRFFHPVKDYKSTQMSLENNLKFEQFTTKMIGAITSSFNCLQEQKMKEQIHNFKIFEGNKARIALSNSKFIIQEQEQNYLAKLKEDLLGKRKRKKAIPMKNTIIEKQVNPPNEQSNKQPNEQPNETVNEKPIEQFCEQIVEEEGEVNDEEAFDLAKEFVINEKQVSKLRILEENERVQEIIMYRSMEILRQVATNDKLYLI